MFALVCGTGDATVYWEARLVVVDEQTCKVSDEVVPGLRQKTVTIDRLQQPVKRATAILSCREHT